MNNWQSIPYFGTGIGYRQPIDQKIIDNHDKIDCIEIIIENWVDNNSSYKKLEQLCTLFNIIPHGVTLSIGSKDLNYHLLKKIKEICQIIKAPYYTEHLAVTRIHNVELGHLSPIWYTEESLNIVVDNINKIQDYLGLPIILENITNILTLPNAKYNEIEFINLLVDRTNCGLLLDINNFHISCINRGFNPIELLKDYPLEKVIHIHLAGSVHHNGLLKDSHGHPVHDSVWNLLDLIKNNLYNLKSTILEQDQNFKNFNLLLDQVIRSRVMLNQRHLR